MGQAAVLFVEAKTPRYEISWQASESIKNNGDIEIISFGRWKFDVTHSIGDVTSKCETVRKRNYEINKWPVRFLTVSRACPPILVLATRSAR